MGANFFWQQKNHYPANIVQLCNISLYIYVNNIQSTSSDFYDNYVPTENPTISNFPFYETLWINVCTKIGKLL